MDEQMDVAHQSAKRGAEREYSDGRSEDAARAKAVGHPAADRNEDGERERIAREHRPHVERRRADGFGDDRHRGVQDGGVERFHEERDCHEPRQNVADRGRLSVRCR